MAVVNFDSHPSSYVDPAGSVFEVGDQIIRGIRFEFAEFYSSLLENHVIQAMMGPMIIETELAPDNAQPIQGFHSYLRHRKISPLSFCYEWPAPMLQGCIRIDLGYLY